MAVLLFLTDRGARHQREAIEAAPRGIEVIMLRRPSEAEVIARIAAAEFVISERDQVVTGAMIRAAPRLKMIVRLGSLAHGIDLHAARAAGVRVSVQPVSSSIVAAEHVVMMMLALVKRLGRSLEGAAFRDPPVESVRTSEDVFRYNWCGYGSGEDAVGQLYGSAVSIFGMGEIGVELARRLRGFGVRAIFYRKRRPYPREVERALGIELAGEEHAARSADVLVSLLPISPETEGAIGERIFGWMKKTAVLVHAGSGGVVDEEALARVLRARRIAGAALDTFTEEPPARDHPLRMLAREVNANVLLTPHVASGTLELDRARDYSEVVRLIEGVPLEWAIK